MTINMDESDFETVCARCGSRLADTKQRSLVAGNRVQSQLYRPGTGILSLRVELPEGVGGDSRLYYELRALSCDVARIFCLRCFIELLRGIQQWITIDVAFSVEALLEGL